MAIIVSYHLFCMEEKAILFYPILIFLTLLFLILLELDMALILLDIPNYLKLLEKNKSALNAILSVIKCLIMLLILDGILSNASSILEYRFLLILMTLVSLGTLELILTGMWLLFALNLVYPPSNPKKIQLKKD